MTQSSFQKNKRPVYELGAFKKKEIIMKNLIIMFVFLFSLGTLVAQTTHNAPVDEDATMTVKVITPFLIWDATPNSTPSIPDVIKGQKRTLDPAEGALLFEMQKESGYTVRLQLRVPQPVDGVNLTAHWYFNDTYPDWSGAFPGVPLDSDWDWFDQQTQGWVTIRVTEIDATGAGSTGVKTFTANAEGWYIGI